MKDLLFSLKEIELTEDECLELQVFMAKPSSITNRSLQRVPVKE